jgi:hypothetical protein
MPNEHPPHLKRWRRRRRRKRRALTSALQEALGEGRKRQEENFNPIHRVSVMNLTPRKTYYYTG